MEGVTAGDERRREGAADSDGVPEERHEAGVVKKAGNAVKNLTPAARRHGAESGPHAAGTDRAVGAGGGGPKAGGVAGGNLRRGLHVTQIGLIFSSDGYARR